MPSRRQKRYAEELEAAEEEERAQATARMLQRKRARVMSGTGNRKSRKAASDPLLSEQERRAIGEAYKQASHWLEDMRRYFTDKLSEANLRNVMKQCTALATGEGVPHTRRSDYFRRGQPVTLDEDLVALRVQANQFLLPEDGVHPT